MITILEYIIIIIIMIIILDYIINIIIIIIIILTGRQNFSRWARSKSRRQGCCASFPSCLPSFRTEHISNNYHYKNVPVTRYR